MKKLIYSYLFLFIPLIISAQTYPHQIEPDTTHRMIMMTDTSVIDSPAMEFLYFSIDSIVEQIARDTLGLDSTYWSLDDSLSLSPINQDNNIILGSLSGNTSLTGGYNFIAGGGLGNDLTTGSYNTIFGQSNFSGIGNLTYNFSSGSNNVNGSSSVAIANFVNGNDNSQLIDDLRYGFINGSNNLESATSSSWYSFINGANNLQNANSGNYNYNFVNGFRNLQNAGSASGLFVNGLDNLTSTSSTVYTFASGAGNFQNVTGAINYSFGNGHYNIINSSGVLHSFASGDSNFRNSASSVNRSTGIGRQNLYSATGTINTSTVIGDQNLYNASAASFVFASGYRNIYQSTSSLSNVIAIGRENGYNVADHTNSIYLGYRQGYTTGGTNKLKIGMTQDSPLIDGDFSTSDVTINDDLYVNSLETSDYLYSTSDQILGGNWVDGDWTLTGNVDTLFFGDPSNIDTVIVSAGDPDQTLSFSDPDLTISGSGGNTIDISGVNYWDTNADGIYTLDNVGINTTPHATHPLYVVGTMWLDGPVRDGNGNFSGGTGNIMTANSGGEFLWESPSNIGLSSFNNDAGFLTSEVDGSTTNELQTLSLSTATLSISSGNAVNLPWYDAGTYVRPSTSIDGVWIPDGLLDKDLQYGTSGQVLSSTGTDEVDWITLPTSPWSTGAGDDIYYNTGVHHVGIGTTNPTTELHVVGDALITGDVNTSGSIVMSGTGDVLDFPSAGNIRDAGGSLGTSGDVLTHDGVGVEWMSVDIAQGVRTSSQTFSSTTYSSITGLSSGLAVGGGIVNTNHIAITTSGYYLVTATTTLSRLSGTDVEAYASLYENSTPIGSEMTVAYLAEGEAQTVSTQTYIYLTSADDISLRVKADDSDSSGFSVGAYNTTITAQLIRS